MSKLGIYASQLKALIYGATWDMLGSNLVKTDSSVSKTVTLNGANPFLTMNYFKDIKEVTDSYGNVFVRFPKVYIKKTQSTTKVWQISKKKGIGYYLPDCFWDFTNNVELPYVDIGKHRASDDGVRLESKPNKYPAHSKNIVQFRTLAQANGAGYQLQDVHVTDLLTAIYYVMFGTIDSQSIVQGFISGQYTNTHLAVIAESGVNRIVIANAFADQYRVGQAISIGTSQGGNQVFYGRTITSITVYDGSNKAINFDGAPVNISIGNMVYNTGYKTGWSGPLQTGFNIDNSGKHPMSFLGVESLIGDMWCFIDGVNINNYQAWVCRNAAQYASNLFASPYEQLGYVNANTSNWLNQLGFDAAKPFAEFPMLVSGTNATYKDYYYQNTGQRIAMLGGYWYSGSSAGLSFWHLGDSSANAYVNFGARLVRKPL